MRIETQARELALQVLYQRDLVADRGPDEFRVFCQENAGDDVVELAMDFVTGCAQEQATLDRVIRETAENWDLSRMATSDRNILRLGVYELLFRQETPPKVAINEAIELAKRFSTENSPTFVNGVLDKIYNTRVVQRIEPDACARADLHVHSTASDGSYAPEELPGLAAKAGLAAMALTDHDSVEGVTAARAVSRAAGVLVVPGVELTAYASGGEGGREIEMHIVGLFVNADEPGLRERLAELRAAREERVRAMASRLAELGLTVDAEAILAHGARRAVGRAHMAQELVRAGHCSGVREAFDRYLAPGQPAYVPKVKITPAEAIEMIHRAGGCSVLCHPGLIAGVGAWVAELASAGLEGLEVHSPAHSAQDERDLLELARRHGLSVAGGSDFHGEVKPDVSIGQEAVSFVELSGLQHRASARA